MNFSNVHPDCREFVETIETLLERRRQDVSGGAETDSWRDDTWGPRTWLRTELEDMVYSSYKQMRQGRIARPPRRDKVMELADYLNCTIEERNRLLLAAHSAPIPPYHTGAALEMLLPTAIAVTEQLALPAMVVNRDWRIHYLTDSVRELYGLTPEQLATIPAEHLNMLRLFFDPALPLYRNLDTSHPSWTRMARQTLYSFKRANLFCQYEPWYVEMVREYMTLPHFAEHWHTVRTDASFDTDPTASVLPPTEPIVAPVPSLRVHSPHGWLRPLMITVGYFQFDFPVVLVFLPPDLSIQNRLADMGVGDIPLSASESPLLGK